MKKFTVEWAAEALMRDYKVMMCDLFPKGKPLNKFVVTENPVFAQIQLDIAATETRRMLGLE